MVSELRESGHDVAAHVGSAADFDCAGQLIERCRAEFGSCDILVNCVGIAEPNGSSILNISPEDWHELINSHLTATFNTCRHTAPLMVTQRGGAIINTSSHAYLGYYGGTGYAAGKGGVNSLTFALAAELREHGVRVNAVCPGARTRLSSGPAYEAKIRDLHARGMLGDLQRDASLAPSEPEHVAALYTFLAGPLAGRISGRLFRGSGGYVGAQDTRGKETLLAFRDTHDGPWPIADRAREIDERL